MDETERESFIGYAFEGFHLKPSPTPDTLVDFITSDEKLFETIHMGAPLVDLQRWKLIVDGMVRRPLRFSLAELKALPKKEVTSFHECFGSPLKPATNPVHRIGNVKWTGVPLHILLEMAGIDDRVQYIWTDGLDRGSFGDRTVDRYQKDLPVQKALSPEVLVAYEMNDAPLSIERGGPVRLVVPGYFGTNSTKWLCRISAQPERAKSPFTTIWYNEAVTVDGKDTRRPVWEVTPHSIITFPSEGAALPAGPTTISGWAWSGSPVAIVEVSIDGGRTWIESELTPRQEFEWQYFRAEVSLTQGNQILAARAIDTKGHVQPLANARNEVNRIKIDVT